jgi:hypothetical protein
MTAEPTPEDRAGTTRTFRTRAENGRLALGGCLFGPGITIIVIALFAGASDPGSGLSVWVALALSALVALPGGWFLVRMLRVGVKVSDGKVTIRNKWRSHTVSTSDIRAVTLVRTEAGSEIEWRATALLASGGSVPLDALGCGEAQAKRPPRPCVAGDARGVPGALGC